MIEAGVDPEEALSKLRDTSRDNARTPYQWDSTENAGFTTGTPWIKVNPRYTEVNYKADRESEDSIFDFYKALTSMRRTHPAIIDGKFKFLMFEHEKMVVYLRECARETILVVANFSDDKVKIELPDEIKDFKWNRILTNYKALAPSLTRTGDWVPWEAEIYTLAK